jgi:maleylacetoacetate isomerase
VGAYRLARKEKPKRAAVAPASVCLHEGDMPPSMTLFSFHTSSASHRVRIALHLKGLPYEYVAVNIQQQDADAFVKYRALNPQALVPALVHGDVTLTQSLAILEYLEEVAPEPALVPKDAAGRARVRSLAQYIVSEIQPMQNLRVVRYLKREFGRTDEQGMEWRRHWVALGLDALEAQLQSRETGAFCHGHAPTIADCCLVPQAHAAKRWGLDVAKWPTIARIAERANALPAFQKAAPDQQPDHVAS